ncbi:sulfate permease family protein [Nitzschia inconspicua]|uniref:Sulfate permease family protein n=1 Tax=Nitzschia inconspicua TaxID=303405 RepID=A0A9K3PDS0_9STRA|nr:sulfate permease family protein [Nitzschia inconspicua]
MGSSYGSSRMSSGERRRTGNDDDGDDEDEDFKPIKDKTWSFGHRRQVATASSVVSPLMKSTTQAAVKITSPHLNKRRSDASTSAAAEGNSSATKCKFKGFNYYLYCLIYAVVNVVIAVPSLFGYAAVIFNNPIFSTNMNALSKLLIFSSLVHQLGFLIFSSLPFAIGTVQDAGLIFLSTMANTIANTMIEDGHSEDEILSTTLALLCSGTALLGLVLIAMGYFKLADAVSYLPMPVVGGYLAFIGYFCVQAGTSLCISKPMMSILDWNLLLDPKNLLLAGPGLASGLVLTLTSRLATNSGVLPCVMVIIPAVFYIVLLACGTSLEEAREAGWVGETSPSVPISDLLHLIDFRQVRWDLVSAIIPTWFGMVFVVSFASCLDVAAISIDMGQPLETNRELATVGICNFLSGLSLGFTGSYIFSQTIFTYRTGIHDRLIGAMIMCVYMYIVASPVNILEIAPLFFLGSALIFIGYDLMFEWLWEVRHQVFLSEYFIVWFTFISIHLVGIDFGILIGILIAICDQIFTTAQATGVNRVERRSRAVYSPEDAKLIQQNAYSTFDPQIMTLEVVGNLFFGSSLSMLNSIYDEIGLNTQGSEIRASTVCSPADPLEALSEGTPLVTEGHKTLRLTKPPKYVVLDLMSVTHLDASATRGCFLQLAKKATKKNILVCASGLSPKIDWMFRAHDVGFHTAEEEEAAKAKLLSADKKESRKVPDKILSFVTAAEALEFCETLLLRRMTGGGGSMASISDEALFEESKEHTISSVLAHFLGCSAQDAKTLDKLMDHRYHREIIFNAGQTLFTKNSTPDAFYIVLNGVVANSSAKNIQSLRQQQPVFSGAGIVKSTDTRYCKSGSGQTVATLWQMGGIFGFNDFLLDRPRTFQTVAQVDGTKVAKFTNSNMNTLKTQDPELHSLMQQVLLRASNLDLANCTCHEI